jgi:hypothetical protein
MILNYFDGNSFKPHGIKLSLPITLGDKNILIEVEVVDSPLY